MRADNDVTPPPVGSRVPEAPSLQEDTAAAVTVITRDEIEAMRGDSVTEVLRLVPGLHVDEPGSRGGISSVYIRGGEANYTVVLIDGVKVNDPTNTRGGSFDFSTLSPDNIERIEIARGPLPASWGATAMAGAINIITRGGGDEREESAEISGATDRYYRALFEARGAHRALDYSFSFSSLDDGQPVEGSEFVSTTFSGNLGVALSDKARVRGTVRYVDSDQQSFPEASGGPEFAFLREQDDIETRQTTIGLLLEHEPFPWWDYMFQVGAYDHRGDVTSPGVLDPSDPFGSFPPSATDSEFRRYELHLRNHFEVSDRIRVTIGGEALFEDGSNEGQLMPGEFLPFPVPDITTDFGLDRDVWAPFGEIEVTPLPGLRLHASARLDVPEDESNEWSSRIAATYTVGAAGTTLRFNWGEGFKLPSFFALGHPIVGDPNLEPETSRSIEAGATQPFWDGRGTASATYFYTEYSDLIDFDDATFMLVNRSEATARGVEFSLGLQPRATLGLTGHATWVETNLKGTDEELPNRPEWRGGVSVRWLPTPALDATLRAVFVGTVHDFSIPTGTTKLDSYARVDASLSWTLTDHIEAYLVVENLFDGEYEESVGFPAPGIRPRIGVHYNR